MASIPPPPVPQLNASHQPGRLDCHPPPFPQTAQLGHGRAVNLHRAVGASSHRTGEHLPWEGRRSRVGGVGGKRGILGSRKGKAAGGVGGWVGERETEFGSLGLLALGWLVYAPMKGQNPQRQGTGGIQEAESALSLSLSARPQRGWSDGQERGLAEAGREGPPTPKKQDQTLHPRWTLKGGGGAGRPTCSQGCLPPGALSSHPTCREI